MTQMVGGAIKSASFVSIILLRKLSGLLPDAELRRLHMTWTWPLPGSYNVAFGEMSALFGVLFLAAAWALAKGWDLMPVAIYGFFAGGAAILVGIRIISLGLTKAPLLSGIGFILSGMGGVFAVPILYLRTHRTLRIMGAVVLIAAAGIWATTCYMAYWMHLSSLAKWLPDLMR